MSLREIKDEIKELEGLLETLKKNPNRDIEKLQEIKTRLHTLYIWENSYEEASAGLL